MPRPIEFDRNQALSDAMQLFWRKGYHLTSMRDLTEATQLQPGSLYAAFKNKQTLFLQALDYYSSFLHASADRILASDKPPLARIQLFFDWILQEITSDEDQKGCLLVNTLLETPPEETEIIRIAAEGLRHVEQRFRELLDTAKAEGTLPPDYDSEGKASLLMAGIFGLRIYVRMRPSKERLRNLIGQLLEVVGVDKT